ncbi:MerR family DNA-binding transcriptional regulator [Streptosporangium sp. NPDC002524]|uniref:MerR family DNA-binding transcriptional regulator n=1 Tax=Streptosporangium sp. NPDC002524 TaxID=3154537 RepID=UPI00332CFA2E
MWRTGQLARMAGVTERTLRHHDKTGLLTPAAIAGSVLRRGNRAAPDLSFPSGRFRASPATPRTGRTRKVPREGPRP